MVFDNAHKRVQSFTEYRAFASRWRDSLRAYSKLKALTDTLNVSRQRHPNQRIPMLTFSALGAFDNVDFYNRYLLDEKATTNAFLEDVALVSYSVVAPSQRRDRYVHAIDDVVQEYHSIVDHRFYYAKTIFFGDGRRNYVEMKGGSQMTTEGVLRVALLNYVVLPCLRTRLTAIEKDTDTTTEAMWDERERMFDQFSEAGVSGYRQQTKDARRKLYGYERDAREVAELVGEAEQVVGAQRHGEALLR
jgi:hypothetical protein